jgi:predicted DNA-binding transcriptional regulator AlpA
MPPLLNEEKAAHVAAVSRGTLRRWRRQGKGPPWHKLGDEPGAAVRYDGSDLMVWLASRRKSDKGLGMSGASSDSPNPFSAKGGGQ